MYYYYYYHNYISFEFNRCGMRSVRLKYESFFMNVSETIVKGLNSGDESSLKDAMQKADDFIKTQKPKQDKEEEKDLPKTKTG